MSQPVQDAPVSLDLGQCPRQGMGDVLYRRLLSDPDAQPLHEQVAGRAREKKALLVAILLDAAERCESLLTNDVPVVIDSA
jgi:hypothetical protein